jgi:PAS domain S-box-containing protein
VAAAILLRLSLDPIFGNRYTYTIVFLAILASAASSGRGPGLFAAVVGTAATNYFLIPPRYAFTIDDGTGNVGQLLNLAISVGIAALGGSLRAAHEKAKASARAEQRQKARLQSVLDLANISILILDTHGIVESVNPAAERMFGYGAAEMAGSSILALVPTDRHDEEKLLFERVAHDEIVEPFETVRRTKSGRLIDVDVAASPIKDPSGTVVGMAKIVRDITERKRTEGALKEREEQLRLYAEHSPVAVAMFDRTMDYLVASRRWSEMYRLGEQPLAGRNHYDVFPDIPLRWKEIHQRCLAGTVERSDEDHFPRADGTVDWLRWEVRPWNQADGSIGGVIVFSEDITVTKRAEQALRDSEGRYRTLFEYAPDGILIADHDSYYLDANASMCRMLGYTRDALIGMHASHIVAAAEIEHIDPALSTIKAREDYHREWQFRRKDGTTFDADVIATQMPDGNLMGMVRDITERKAANEALRDAEERMRFALESASVGIWDMSYESGALRWSECLERQYGLDPGTFPGRMEAFLGLVHDEDRANVVATVRKAMATGGAFAMRHRIVRPDGAVRWLSGAGRIDLGPTGAPRRGLGISIDVTEQRQLEEQYRQAQKMEAIGRLAGGVAHDFNNLLTAILGYCELLVGEFGPDDPRRDDVIEIQRAGASAAALTGQLLAFSRKQIIEPALVNLNTVVNGLRGMLERLIGEDIIVSVHVQPDLPLISADRTQLEQVLVNLAVNARDAMPRGGTLTIETAAVDLDDYYEKTHFQVTAGHYVLLTVSDTGTGMTPEVQSRLFEPFFTTKEVGRGTGLGLASVHGIVTASGGLVNVYSEVGHGTTFKVYFPRVDGALEDEGTTAPAVAAPPSARTVLVIDDAESIRELTRRLLERQGYTVYVAATGDEAVALFNTHGSIDLLLTDVVMPGASGPELTAQLVESRPGLKVIYMSGYTEEAIVHHGVLNPGVAFLQKPFGSERLASKLREVLGES